MHSIFNVAEASTFFWSRAGEACLQDRSILLETCFEFDRVSAPIERQVVLCPPQLFLIRTDELPDCRIAEAKATVSFMTLSRYYSHGKTGFVLKSGAFSETFTHPDAGLIETWIEALKPLCICENFDDDYETLEYLGKGTLSDVFLVSEKRTRGLYAAKIIEKERLVSKNHIKGVIREVAILRKLNHRCIVKIERVYEDHEKVWIILEYIKGQSMLKKLEQDVRFTEDHALRITRELMEVLDYLTSQQIVHRDIKPENILLNETENSITLVDFGLAIECQDDTTQTCGSPGFVAPEILCKQGCSNKSDVFSAGVLLYVMLSGRAPFGTKDKREVIQRNRAGVVSFPKEYWRNVSVDSVNLVLEMMAVDSWARPEAKEVLQSLLVSPSTAPSSPFSEDYSVDAPAFNLESLEVKLPPREKRSKAIMMSLKDLDDSLAGFPRRNSIPRSSNFVLDPSSLRKAHSTQFY